VAFRGIRNVGNDFAPPHEEEGRRVPVMATNGSQRYCFSSNSCPISFISVSCFTRVLVFGGEKWTIHSVLFFNFILRHSNIWPKTGQDQSV
jgi:hypothetical protein